MILPLVTADQFNYSCQCTRIDIRMRIFAIISMSLYLFTYSAFGCMFDFAIPLPYRSFTLCFFLQSVLLLSPLLLTHLMPIRQRETRTQKKECIYIQLLLLQYLQTQLRWKMSVIRGRYRSSAERTKASRTSDGSAVAAIQ